MKKSLFVAVLLLSALTMSAREYQHSVGLYAGNSFGLSYKGYVRGQEHLVIETNLMTQLIVPGQYSYGYAAAATIFAKTKSATFEKEKCINFVA